MESKVITNVQQEKAAGEILTRKESIIPTCLRSLSQEDEMIEGPEFWEDIFNLIVAEEDGDSHTNERSFDEETESVGSEDELEDCLFDELVEHMMAFTCSTEKSRVDQDIESSKKPVEKYDGMDPLIEENINCCYYRQAFKEAHIKEESNIDSVSVNAMSSKGLMEQTISNKERNCRKRSRETVKKGYIIETNETKQNNEIKFKGYFEDRPKFVLKNYGQCPYLNVIQVSDPRHGEFNKIEKMEMDGNMEPSILDCRNLNKSLKDFVQEKLSQRERESAAKRTG